MLSDIPLALGGLLGLFVLGIHRNSEASLVQCLQLLRSYARHEEFDYQWLQSAHRDIAITLLLWIAAVAERIRGTRSWLLFSESGADVWSILPIIGFGVSSLLIFALAFCMLYFCQAMVCAVDTFCIYTTTSPTDSLKTAVPRWNLVQAMLRKASGSVQSALFVLQTTAFLWGLLALVDVYQSWQGLNGYTFMLIPGSFLMIGIARIFFKAADVTSRCARVPPLINAITFGPDFDPERQYVVEYILHSAAGFYLFEIRLTSDMTLKFAYLCVVAIFTLMTQILSEQ